MRRLLLWLMVGVMGLVWVLPGAAVGQQAWSAPTVFSQATFPVTNSPSQFSVVQRVVDFPPGTGIGPHFYGGNQYVTVIDGEITLQMNGAVRVYKPGESWVEATNVVHAGGNNGTTTARIMTTALVAPGAVYSTSVETPAALPVTGGAPLSIAWLVAGWAALGLGLGLKGYRLRRRSSGSSTHSVTTISAVYGLSIGF